MLGIIGRLVIFLLFSLSLIISIVQIINKVKEQPNIDIFDFYFGNNKGKNPKEFLDYVVYIMLALYAIVLFIFVILSPIMSEDNLTSLAKRFQGNYN